MRHGAREASSRPSPFARTASAHYDRPAPAPAGFAELAAEMGDILARYGQLGVPLWLHVAARSDHRHGAWRVGGSHRVHSTPRGHAGCTRNNLPAVCTSKCVPLTGRGPLRSNFYHDTGRVMPGNIIAQQRGTQRLAARPLPGTARPGWHSNLAMQAESASQRA